MSKLLRRTIVGIALGAILYAVAVVWFGARDLGAALQPFRWWMLPAALGLSSVNYLLRFAKWELSLGWLGVRGDGPDDAPDLSRGRSLVIYLAGLSMSVTPGKIGEVLRSWLLKASDGVSFARTAPIVVADRATDLIALIVLSLVGVATYTEYLPHVVVTATLVGLGIAVLGVPRWSHALLAVLARLPGVGGVFERAGEMVDSAAALVRFDRLAALTGLSVVGWGLECLGYWLILRGFPGVDPTLRLCVFLWSTTTIIGAISFLPGGLGATEGSLAVLATRLVAGATQPVAVASTMLIRACTLWYGELVGGIALAWFMRDPKLRERAQAAASADERASTATPSREASS